jgi:hypothetical protein
MPTPRQQRVRDADNDVISIAPTTHIACSRCGISYPYGEMSRNDETNAIECMGCYLVQPECDPVKISSATNPFLIETWEHYRSQRHTHISSHQLSEFRKCPAAFYARMMAGDPPGADSPAFAFGRAFHALVLEGQNGFDRDFVVGGPVNPSTGKPYGRDTQKYADWLATQGTKTCIQKDDADVILKMRDSILAHEHAQRLVHGSIAECVIRVPNYCGWPCQGRIDGIARGFPDAIFDVKTCANLDWFEDDARRFGYANQLAFYQHLHMTLGCNETLVFPYLIAVEKQEPYRCGVWQISRETFVRATVENENSLRMMRECTSANKWPTNFEDVRSF